jgi:hypothetical protein
MGPFRSLFLASTAFLWPACLGEEPGGGALAGPRDRPRVVVSTDIGGSDPDDYQSMVHFLLYADVLEVEGLIASPPGAGRARHVLEVIDAYETDYAKLRSWSVDYPTPQRLREVTRQGAVDSAPPEGYSGPTDGSRWIVARARAEDRRPLWILVWGSITDVAQALHDAPDAARKIRVVSIGAWNTRHDRAARDYVFRAHPELWWIESDTAFRGMYLGGVQDGDLSNRRFLQQHVGGHGALGDLLVAKKDVLKMGDTPSVLYLLRGDPDDPSAEHWGGAYVRKDPRRTRWTDDPRPELREGEFAGARTVSKWRRDILRDFEKRMDRAAAATRD